MVYFSTRGMWEESTKDRLQNGSFNAFLICHMLILSVN